MKLPKAISYALRLGLTGGAMALAFRKVPAAEVLPLVASTPWFYLAAAVVLTHLGQILSVLRTRYYLHAHGIDLPLNPSIRLHYIGGLFNVFLPGGAGGDAYKAWWLKRHKQGKLMNMVGLMISNRLNGLWALGVLTCLLGFFSQRIRALVPQPEIALLGLVFAGTFGYSLFARYALKEPVAQQVRAGGYSLLIQIILVAIAYALCLGLGLEENALEYMTLFMLSCILAMMPISIGGIGVRELALLHGSQMLGLSEHAGVSLGLSFTLVSLTIPLVGAIIYHAFALEQEATA